MANEQQTQPQVAIPLPKGKKNAVQIGCTWRVLTQWDMYPCSLSSPDLEYLS